MTTDLDRKAREPKFGDWLRGIYASERNPIRDGIYVRTCRVNHETCYELTDGKGKFWMYPKRSTERLDRPSVFEEAALRLAVPEDWVAVPRRPTVAMHNAIAMLNRRPRIGVDGDNCLTLNWEPIDGSEAWRAAIAAAPTLADEGES